MPAQYSRVTKIVGLHNFLKTSLITVASVFTFDTFRKKNSVSEYKNFTEILIQGYRVIGMILSVFAIKEMFR